MKKIVIVVLIGALLLGACGRTEKTNVNEDKGTSNNEIGQEQESEESNGNSEKITASFNVLIKENKKPFELIDYFEENIEYVTIEQATKMMEDLIQVQDIYLFEYTDQFFNGDSTQELMYQYFGYFGYDFDPDNIENIKEDELRELLQETLDSGYKIVSTEGAFMPIIDYKILEQFGQYITPEMRDYIEILARESNKIAVHDAEIIISWDELAERIVLSERYLDMYPDSPRNLEIKGLNYGRLMLYLKGLDNTPTFRFIDEKLLDEMLESYKRTITKFKGTELAQTTESYLKVLEENNFKFTQDVEEFILNLHDGFQWNDGLSNDSDDLGLNMVEKRVNTDTLDISYPEINGLEDKELVEKINKLIEEKANEFIEEDDVYEEDRDKISYWSSYSITYLKNNLLSIRFDPSSYFEGAAHPNNFINSITINLEDGEVYNLEDLFNKDNDYKSKLRELVTGKITEEEIPIFDEYKGIEDNQGYYLTDDGINIYYQTYVYTPHAFGPLNVLINYSEINDILEYSL